MKVFWAYDVISPFSYLSLKQLPLVPQGTEIEPVPVLFASLLNHHGQIGNAEIDPKRLFTYRFCLWRARRLGIAMRFPPSHPFNPLMALRLILAAGNDIRAAETVFDAAWRDGRDVSQTEVIDDVGRQLGLKEPLGAISEPAVKQKLLENGAWAISRGLFGVPSFVVDEQIFWGHDGFEMALDYLRNPKLFQDAEMKKLESLPVGVSRPRKS